ncbi:MAG: YgiQ family radical SAM protein, partial [Pirellulaceae bacterium]
VVFGMGEELILEIARRLDAGQSVKDLRDMRGVAYALGASEKPPEDALVLPSYEEVVADKPTFAEATKIIHNETNPYNARRLVQFHDKQAVVCNPPRLPVSERSMDVIYGLPYTRRAHPTYTEPIPAFDMIKDSVTIMRGCFGGCTFCSITTHQGRIIQSRSPESVLGEIREMGADPKFKGTISDIGGPTANMYQMTCSRPEVEAVCRRQSCVHPTICKLLGTDHGPLVDVMKQARETPGIKKVLVASGIRMDLARRSPQYMKELVQHHVGGHLKVAPEHTDPDVLMKMRKPANDDFEKFAEVFDRESKKAGKKQYIVPYFIASHPASDLDAMINLAVFLKLNGYRPDQVQDFIPAPFDVATAMYYTGLDPFTKKKVYVAQHLRDRKLQRALMQFFKPENYFEVRDALRQAKRTDLIGEGCDCLIPSQPPKEAIDRRRKD